MDIKRWIVEQSKLYISFDDNLDDDTINTYMKNIHDDVNLTDEQIKELLEFNINIIIKDGIFQNNVWEFLYKYDFKQNEQIKEMIETKIIERNCEINNESLTTAMYALLSRTCILEPIETECKNVIDAYKKGHKCCKELLCNNSMEDYIAYHIMENHNIPEGCDMENLCKNVCKKVFYTGRNYKTMTAI